MLNSGRRVMGKLLLGLAASALMVCAGGASASAQSRMEVFGGYSYGTSGFNDFCDFGCATESHGYAASFTYNLTPNIGMEGTFTGHKGSSTPDSEVPSVDNGFTDKVDASNYIYTFGPRLSLPAGNFSLYSHFLVGGTHLHENFSETCFPGTDESCGTPNPEAETFNGNGFAFKVGGGVDWHHGSWGIRILEVNYIHNQISLNLSSNEGFGNESLTLPSNSFELATGITLNLGGSLK
jgi:hypothetical protein